MPDPNTQVLRDKRPVVESDGHLPKPPNWLTAEAKKIFRDAAKKAVELGIAGSADTNALAIYAMQNVRMQELYTKNDRDIREERLLNDLVSSIGQWAKELGLSPGGRARMRVAPKTEEFNVENFFEDIDTATESIKH
jgi:phage terminase small subunit